jgi:L-ascorbate metabolism protein UlaG (beta-lactamase superfamily)
MIKVLKKILKAMLVLFVTIAVLIIGIAIFVNTAPQFGAVPKGGQLASLKSSPNYSDGQFQNLVETNMNMAAREIPGLMMKFSTGRKSREPQNELPSKFDFSQNLRVDSLIYVTWFGHSAILLEIEGKRILIDPMLGPAASPVSFMTKRFPYEDPIDLDEIDNIDAIILSHDHYDHLDYPSIIALKDKVDHFYTALAVGEHLKRWGVAEDKITELDWWQSSNLDHIQLVATPARHFSGRGLTNRNKSQWASWVIIGKHNRIYFSGDSGYAGHFKEIGDKYGPFDFTMMECGQYNELWKVIHMMPEQSVQAHIDLKGKVMMPIHWGAFNLALHDWTDPILRASAEAEKLNVNLVHPIIGDTFVVGTDNSFRDWWREAETTSRLTEKSLDENVQAKMEIR